MLFKAKLGCADKIRAWILVLWETVLNIAILIILSIEAVEAHPHRKSGRAVVIQNTFLNMMILVSFKYFFDFVELISRSIAGTVAMVHTVKLPKGMALSDDQETWPSMLQKIIKWNESFVIMPWIPCAYGWAVCVAVDGFMDCTDEFNHKLPEGYCDGTEKKFPLDVA